MAITHQIENLAWGSEIDLNSDTNIKALTNEPIERPLSFYTMSDRVTYVFRFKVAGTTKANVRTNANALVSKLRGAIEWRDDIFESQSVWYAQSADGETLTRQLIVDYELRAITESAFTPFQSVKDEVVVTLSLTCQNHSEERQRRAFTMTDITADANAIGRSILLSVSDHTKLSRIITEINSGTDSIERLWIGLMRYNGADFQHLWELEDGTELNGSGTTTQTGSYATNVVEVDNTDFTTHTDMTARSRMSMDDAYSTVNYDHGKGEYLALLRYKLSATGTVLARIGISYSATSGVAYNEPRLLDDSTNWRFAPMGVVSFPPRGLRFETTLAQLGGGAYALSMKETTLWIDAQRLAGSCALYLDTITLIPYRHFISLDNTGLGSGKALHVHTHEHMITEAITRNTTSDYVEDYATVTEIRNWFAPTITGTYLQMVIAGEGDTQQVKDDTIDVYGFDIYPAYEGFNG